jgi:hypothetical protein
MAGIAPGPDLARVHRLPEQLSNTHAFDNLTSSAGKGGPLSTGACTSVHVSGGPACRDGGAGSRPLEVDGAAPSVGLAHARVQAAPGVLHMKIRHASVCCLLARGQGAARDRTPVTGRKLPRWMSSASGVRRSTSSMTRSSADVGLRSSARTAGSSSRYARSWTRERRSAGSSGRHAVKSWSSRPFVSFSAPSRPTRWGAETR